METTDETQDAIAGSRAPAAREDPRTPENDGQIDPPPQEDKAAQLAQLRELKAKLDEDRERLVLLEQILEQDQPYPLGESVRRRAREVHRQIIGDGEPEQPVSRFPRAGQNVVAATMLLRNMPEPTKSQAQRIRDEVQTLLQVAAVQQAESSASRRRGAATEKRDEPAQNEKDVSVHQNVEELLFVSPLGVHMRSPTPRHSRRLPTRHRPGDESFQLPRPKNGSILQGGTMTRGQIPRPRARPHRLTL